MTTKLIRELRDALKALSFAAQISGGTAGRDHGLCAAIEPCESVIAQADAYLREQERGEVRRCRHRDIAAGVHWRCDLPEGHDGNHVMVGDDPNAVCILCGEKRGSHDDATPCIAATTASAPADANAATMDDMNYIVLRELAKEEAPADAPVAWQWRGNDPDEGCGEWLPLDQINIETIRKNPRNEVRPLYTTPPAPASGAVSDEDIEASARAIYATANKNYVGWPAAVQFSDDALRTFASRHASQPAGAVSDAATVQAMNEIINGMEISAIDAHAAANVRAMRIAIKQRARELAASPAQAVSVPDGWREIVDELATDLSNEIESRMSTELPRRIERDLDVVRRARAMLAAAPSPPQHDKGSEA